MSQVLLAQIPVNGFFRFEGLPYRKVGSARAALAYKWDHLDSWGRSGVKLRDVAATTLVSPLSEQEACGSSDAEFRS